MLAERTERVFAPGRRGKKEYLPGWSPLLDLAEAMEAEFEATAERQQQWFEEQVIGKSWVVSVKPSLIQSGSESPDQDPYTSGSWSGNNPIETEPLTLTDQHVTIERVQIAARAQGLEIEFGFIDETGRRYVAGWGDFSRFDEAQIEASVED